MVDSLETELRDLLRHVDLVCDASISDSQLDLAERAFRRDCNKSNIELWSTERPATLVSYVVLRGSERYRRNSVWPELGVVGNSGRVGDAFLRSLRRIGLRTFEQETAVANARRFVAPLLIHGAIPSRVAGKVVDRLQVALRRGVIDAAEARARLEADPDLVVDLGRPASRLITWAPEYAEQLFDLIFEHIEDPSRGSIQLLPVHLQRALEDRAVATSGLRRVRPPEVRFEFWAGFGPEIDLANADRNWSVVFGPDSSKPATGSTIEVDPNQTVTATSSGRRLQLWKPANAWYFEPGGRPISVDRSLPDQCVVLLPTSSTVKDSQGSDVPIIEEGAALGGPWSRYYSVLVDLQGVDAISIGGARDETDPAAGRAVAHASTASFEGAVVPHVFGPGRMPVHGALPTLCTPQHGNTEVRLRFDSKEHGVRVREVTSDAIGRVSLESLIPPGPVRGTLDVQFVSGSRTRLPLIVVPGLIVEVPSEPLGPDESGTIEVLAEAGVLVGVHTIPLPVLESSVALPVQGFPAGLVGAQLPRLTWSVRSERNRRLRLEPGVVVTDTESLTAERFELLVRCGMPASIGAVLCVDGVDIQRTPPRQSTSIGLGHHHLAIDLSIFRDSIRAHSSTSVAVDLNVGGKRFTAIQCGEPHGPVMDPSSAPRSFPGALLAAESELENRRAMLARDRRINENQLELQLRLEGTGGLLGYLQLLGKLSRAQPNSVASGTSPSSEWEQLNDVARRVWEVNGIRNRLYAGADLEERLASWASGWGQRLEREPPYVRNELQLWMSNGRTPTWALSQWAHHGWIRRCLPRSASVVQQVPAAVLYHCLAAATAERASEEPVLQATRLRQELVVEAAAFVSEVVRRLIRLEPPDLAEHEKQPLIAVAPDESEHASVAPVTRLTSFDDCVVDIDGREIQLLPDQPCESPVLRLSTGGRSRAIVRMSLSDDLFVARVPEDVHGEVTVALAESTLLDRTGSNGVKFDVPPSPSRKGDSFRVHTLGSLGDALSGHLVERIHTALVERRPLDAPVEELFEDEHAAASALARFSLESAEPHAVDLAALAIAPAAFLFSSLGLDNEMLSRVRSRSKLMYAALAPKTPHGWTMLGWPPNARFDASIDTSATFVRWVRSQSQNATIGARTWRYHADETTLERVTAYSTHRLESNGADPGFVDLVIASNCLVSNDTFSTEAMRTIADAYISNPSATERAVLAGFLLHLISQGQS